MGTPPQCLPEFCDRQEIADQSGLRWQAPRDPYRIPPAGLQASRASERGSKCRGFGGQSPTTRARSAHDIKPRRSPQCSAGRYNTLVARKPSRETGLGKKSFVPCDRRGTGLHISETRRRAENPLAAKKQFVRYSHPIVSQNQTKPGGGENARCTSNRKNSKCHLSRCVTNSYVDMRIRQPDSSVRYQLNAWVAEPSSARRTRGTT